jgi:hypothetical protein
MDSVKVWESGSMNSREHFSQAILNDIFALSPKTPNCVNSRESSNLEFKESFGLAGLAAYTKTFAAFSNTKGGYIVFGIANRPHRLVGLTAKALRLFEDLDPQKVSGFLNEHFAPEIHWEMQVHQVGGKDYGLLYVHESSEKPVMCTRDGGSELKEGDIYYRYRGRTTRIRYPELVGILEARRKQEEGLWLRHLTKLTRVGIRDAGLFDLKTGQISGATGSFLIDESLLSQLAFIKEGHFSEVAGKPTLKLIGQAQVTGIGIRGATRTRVVYSKGIRITDIILVFLAHDKVKEPNEYIRQICFEGTPYLPVYYFMKMAGYDAETTRELINGVVSRSPAKEKLLKRLSGGVTQHISLPISDAVSAKTKRSLALQAKNHNLDRDLSGRGLLYGLQAIRSFSRDDVKTHSEYLRDIVRHWFNRHYSTADGTLAGEIRRTICWLDEALYKEAVLMP